jgi:hypothetical protein
MGIFLNLAEIGLERVKGYQIVDWAIGYFLIWIYRHRSENECRDVAVLRLYKVYGQRIFKFGRCLMFSGLSRFWHR